jgi:hypothetical protein
MKDSPNNFDDWGFDDEFVGVPEEEEFRPPDELTVAYRAFVDRFAEFMRSIPGYWVAFEKSELVARDLDYPRLLKKLVKQNYKDLSRILIAPVAQTSYIEASELLSSLG